MARFSVSQSVRNRRVAVAQPPEQPTGSFSERLAYTIRPRKPLRPIDPVTAEVIRGAMETI